MAEYPKGPDRRVTSNILLTIITVFITGFVLRLARSVFIPILIAVFLTYLMDPLVTLLRRLKVPVIVSVLIAAVIFLGAFSVFSFILYQNSLDFAKKIPSYQAKFVNLLRDLTERIQIATDQFFDVKIIDEVRKIPVASIVLSTLSSLAGFLADFLLIFLFSLLILAGKYVSTRKLLRSFPRREAKKIALVLLHIDRDLRKFVGIKSFVCMVIGLTSGVTLALFRIEFAVILGFLTFVLNFIPYLGSVIAVVVPVVIALLQYASLAKALWIFLALVVLQNLVGQVLEPKLVGSGLRISVPVVFFTLFFWGWLWGAPGVLLAVPMTTSIKIVMEDIPGLRPFALLLEKMPRRGRPRRAKRR